LCEQQSCYWVLVVRSATLGALLVLSAGLVAHSRLARLPSRDPSNAATITTCRQGPSAQWSDPLMLAPMAALCTYCRTVSSIAGITLVKPGERRRALRERRLCITCQGSQAFLLAHRSISSRRGGSGKTTFAYAYIRTMQTPFLPLGVSFRKPFPLQT
jgi:hypothetical protein